MEGFLLVEPERRRRESSIRVLYSAVVTLRCIHSLAPYRNAAQEHAK
jgi:hypothetical protein